MSSRGVMFLSQSTFLLLEYSGGATAASYLNDAELQELGITSCTFNWGRVDDPSPGLSSKTSPAETFDTYLKPTFYFRILSAGAARAQTLRGALMREGSGAVEDSCSLAPKGPTHTHPQCHRVQGEGRDR